ncbi:hypothetical protein SRABI27_01520 [Pedobacter sp. Bi27]|uniref:PorT family protein n=1 Tax=unclassified Pedobacter TaxID=2628915 RepID=UPI001E005410|nr:MULTISPECIES: PorT family protein [unclassified Pedobacter]CAH0167684.1 hypothetical protein SRABI36_01181 [Pedobacter sp. Bi36]CAH0191662.1 hypothetical protein SRABI27_01520 [Pedobacter sp. Bi27]CAH0223522.1 hypothetical protein SRABI126_02273 [Pedobacter sp. Bi126]
MRAGKDIDKLFKDGLENPDLPFNDLDWDNLEERLHPAPKRTIVPIIWLTAAAAVAAMLLVVFLLVKPDGDRSKTNPLVKTKTNENNKPLNNDGGLIEKPTNNDSLAKDREESLLTENNKGAEESKDQKIIKTGFVREIFPKVIEKGNSGNHNLLADVIYNPEIKAETKLIEFEKQNLVADPVRGKIPRIKDPVFKKKPRFVLSILAAPDLTSVQKSGRSSLSGGFGVEATLFLTKKLSVTTGAAYAKKIYDSDFSQYNPNSNYVFKANPANIHANCDVIDIPINVNYKVFDGRRNSISVSTGLSSYLMLKEKYSYSYNGAYQGPQSYEVRNQNQHYLGIANVGVEFQHKINNNLSISAKPFMKIPLTNIGYGNSKLSSTGVAVSVNMNLFGRKN